MDQSFGRRFVYKAQTQQMYTESKGAKEGTPMKVKMYDNMAWPNLTIWAIFNRAGIRTKK